MFSTDANPFGNVTVQPWLATTTSEAAVRAPERLLQPESAFVLPKAEPPRQAPQNAQPNPMILFSNALGFSSLANYLFGNKVGSNSSNSTKTTSGTSFVDSAGWDDDTDPITGEPRLLSAYRRIPSFIEDNDSPFTRSLDVVF